MSSTFAILALAGSLTTSLNPASLTFEKDYSEARQLGRELSKPLAVFVGAGENGWDKVCPDKIGTETTKVLAENYVCVYVNREEERGKQLAADFEIADGPGLVISNRAGDLQAFRHEGEIPADALTRQLQRFADPTHVVQQTETLKPATATVLPANGQVAPATAPYYYRSYYAPPFSGGFGRGCAGGR